MEEVGEVSEVKDEEESPSEAEFPRWFAGSVDLSSLTGTRSSLPGERSTARSTKFSSSRMLPGQE